MLNVESPSSFFVHRSYFPSLMEPLPAIPLPNLPPPETVFDDLPCRTCSYNLRTLATSASCPECGCPVSESLNRFFLRDSNPAWLMLLRRSLLVLTFGLVVLLIASERSSPQGSVRWAITWAARVVAVIGGWILCSPNPGNVIDDDHERLRVGCRTFFISYLVLAFLFSALPYLDLFGNLMTLRFWLNLAAGAALGGALAVLLYYLSRLTWDIPDPPFAVQLLWGARFVAVLYAADMVISVISWAFVPIVYWWEISRFIHFIVLITAAGFLNRFRTVISRDARN
jgi:hypothetical protein